MQRSDSRTGSRARDAAIFAAVEAWVRATAFDEYRRLRKLRRIETGRTDLRIACPRFANEKFLWRKLFDHDPRFTILSDKQASKEWVARQGVPLRLPQTLWIGTDAAEIPDDLWQRPVYLKATHGSAMNIPVLSPPEDRDALIARANAFLSVDWSQRRRQWGYKGVTPRLIVEEAITARESFHELKFYVCAGVVEQVYVQRTAPDPAASNWFREADGHLRKSEGRTSRGGRGIDGDMPEGGWDGLPIARALGAGFDLMRVDMFLADGQLYQGEMTVYNMAGRVQNFGFDWDAPPNRLWDLRRSWFLTTPQPGWRGIYARALRRAIDARAGDG